MMLEMNHIRSLYYKYEVLFLKSCAKFDMMNKDIDTISIYSYNSLYRCDICVMCACP